MDSKSSLRHTEIAEGVRPRPAIVFITTGIAAARSPRTPVELLGEKRRHVGLAQADHVGKEQQPVYSKTLRALTLGFFLILEPFEMNGNVNVFQFSGPVEFILEVFVKEFHIQLVRRELREGRTVDDCILVKLETSTATFQSSLNLAMANS